MSVVKLSPAKAPSKRFALLNRRAAVEAEPMAPAANLLTKEHLAARFAELRTELEESKRDSLYTDERKGAFRLLNRAGERLQKLDLERLSRKDRADIEAMLYDQLPKTVREIVSTSYARGWSWISVTNMLDPLSSAHDNLLVAIERKQLDPKYEQHGPATVAAGSAELSGLTFPTRQFADARLRSALSQLASAWDIARQRQLNAEERYLIEQIAISYLPESWVMIQGFETFPQHSREQVERQVLEQLNLLTEQVEQVLNRNVAVMLSAVEAHTQFLRAKRDNAKPSRLHLLPKRR